MGNVVYLLCPRRYTYNIKIIISKYISSINVWSISDKTALRRMPSDLIIDWSTSVQVVAWCRQATSHYKSHCWPRSMSPYGVTRPQLVNVTCNGAPNTPLAQIPKCTIPMPHNAPFCNRNVNMCTHFCYKMVHCGQPMRDGVLGFVRWVNFGCNSRTRIVFTLKKLFSVAEFI